MGPEGCEIIQVINPVQADCEWETLRVCFLALWGFCIVEISCKHPAVVDPKAYSTIPLSLTEQTVNSKLGGS